MAFGLLKESEEFGRLGMTNESKGLVSLFFGQTALKKNRYILLKKTCFFFSNSFRVLALASLRTTTKPSRLLVLVSWVPVSPRSASRRA